jgi:hypothetical protein
VTKDSNDGAVAAFLRGNATYAIHYNVDNPTGTIMSIEHVLRSLETVLTRLENEITHDEKALIEYQVQSEIPFEYEARLQELLIEQTRLNAMLDLDKDDKQAVTADNDNEEAPVLDVDGMTATDMPERGDNDNEAILPVKPIRTGTLDM